MRRLYILGEGQTEEEFINEVLRPYLTAFDIYDVRCILMQTSPGHKGGAVTYSRYKNYVERLLKQEQDIIVTSLIDFYKLKSDFPEFSRAQELIPIDKIERVEFLEEAIKRDITNPRFIPYIQLHEFEGLLFSSTAGFDSLPGIPDNVRNQLNQAVTEHTNPELLNDGEQTAPSKRLEKIPGYQKTLHGPVFALEISIDKILSRCERFRNWTQKLISEMQK